MKDENWEGIFAIAPQYYGVADEERLIEYNGSAIARLSGLKTFTQYAVYVRNVSGIRTLSDGSQVTRSEKGVVKLFQTTRTQLLSLRKDIRRRNVPYTVYGPTGNVCDLVYTPRIGFNQSETNVDYFDQGTKREWYRVNLSQGSVYIFTEAQFPDVSAAAEARDKEWKLLPLSPQDLGLYADPNLSYTAYVENKEGRWDVTDLIKVDSQGKITLKGVGEFYIHIKNGSGCTCGAGDATTENCKKCAYLPLRVTADVDSIVPKKNNMQLQVGESARLVDLLNYKVGKKVVKGYNELAEVYADDTLRAAIEQNGCFELNASGDRITAVKEGALSSVTLKESSLNLTSTPFTLTAKLDAVKSLKVNHIIDDRLQIEFIRPDYKFGKEAYEISGNDDDRVGYRIEIKDTRGVTRNEVRWDNSWYNAKDKKWHCRYDITGLTQQSQYTISVYTIFRKEVSAKAATKKVKTTKLAIRDSYLENWTEGGLTVSVSEAISAEGKHAPTLEAYGENAFTSGNIYTLTASAQSGRTRAKMTDTLKWSSTNSKVASVKAGGGTFSASLKALKPGTAVIEARSKIWKNRVVARYTVTVYALGDAYKNTNRYFDQNEPKDPNESDEPYTPGSIKLPLSAGEKRKVSVGERKTFTFTVPEAGKYSFHSYGSTMYVSGEIWKGNSYIENLYGSSVDKELGWLKAGDKYTFIINHVEPNNGNYKTETACFIGITLDQKVWPVANGKLEINDAERYQEYFRYKADADGYYRFIAPNGEDGNYDIRLFKNETDMVNGNSFALGNNGWYFMEAGEEVYGYVNIGIGNSTTLTVTKNAELKAGTPTNVSITGGEYIYFKADADGYYQFYSTDADANITAQFTLESGTFSSSKEDKNFYLNCELKAGDEGYLKVTTASLGTPAPTVNVRKTGQELTITEGTADNKATVSLAPGKDSEQYVSFTAPKNGYYHFYTTGAKDSDKVRLEVIGGDNGSDVYHEMKAGEKIWVKITSSPAEKVDIELHVKDETPETIAAGAAATAVPANTRIIRAFTASENGCYEFTISGETYGVQLSLYASILNAQEEQLAIATCTTTGDADPYIGTIRRVMKAGDTILLAAENEGEAALSVAVSKVENTDSFTVGETPELTLAADGNGWKCFTADQTGLYTFTFKPNTSYIYAGLVKNYSSSDPEYVVGQNTVYTSGWTTDPYAMEAGEAIWLYAENPVSSEVKVTLSAKRDGEFAVLSQDAEPQVLALSSSKREQWARFTAKQSGVYSFKFSPDDGYVYGYLYDEYGNTSSIVQSDSNRNKDFVLCYKMDAGQSIWLKARNSSSSSVNVGISVSLKARLSISESSVKTVELLPDETEWVRFTASQSGIYRFTYDYKSGSLHSGQTHEYGSVDYDGSSIFGLSAGESVWMYVRNTGSTALSVDLKAEFQEEAYIELGKDQVATGQYSVFKWVQFTAPSNGTYIFKATAPECKLNSNLCKKYQDDYISSAYNKAESAELAAYLTEGDSVWFSGYAEAESYSDDVTLTLNVSQKTPVTLSTGESVYKIYAQTAEWAYFKAGQEGLYHFEVSVDSEYSQYIYYGLCETEGKDEYIFGTDKNIYSSNSTPYRASLYMQSGDEVWLYTRSGSYDAQITANITMENPNLTADENGNLSKTVDLNNTTNQKLWTRFTATEAGTYAFRFDASYSIQSRLCETYTAGNSPTAIAYPDGSSGSYSANTAKTVFYYAMKSGDSVWLYAYNSSSNNTVTVSVTKEDRETSVGATDFTNGEQKIALPGYEVKLLKFKADKAGEYSFKFTRNSGYTYYLSGGLRASDNIYNSTSTENWSNIGTDYFTSLSSPATYSWEALQEGDIIWLWVQNRSSDDSEVTIEVTAPKDTDPTP